MESGVRIMEASTTWPTGAPGAHEARRGDWRSSFALPALSLAQREIVRFIRQPSRVMGGLATPVLFWLLLGSGLDRSFAVPGGGGHAGYREYFFTGSVVLIVLFTAIFATISIIEDRREGFLQSVLVSPAHPLSIAVGKILGAALLALLHASAFVLLAPLMGFALSAAKLLAVLGTLFVLSVGLGGLGFVVAWMMDSTQGFHSVMNLFLIPMWILSGAVFPSSGASAWIRAVMALNPLTYGVSAVRRLLESGGASSDPSGPALGGSMAITCVFAVVTCVLAGFLVRVQRKAV